MIKCHSCKYYFFDNDTGYSECMKADDFNDDDYEVYENGEYPENCQYFEEEEPQ